MTLKVFIVYVGFDTFSTSQLRSVQVTILGKCSFSKMSFNFGQSGFGTTNKRKYFRFTSKSLFPRYTYKISSVVQYSLALLYVYLNLNVNSCTRNANVHIKRNVSRLITNEKITQNT